MAGSSPAVLGVMFSPLPFAEDDIENATLEAQAKLRRQVLSKKDRRLLLPWVEVLQQPASQQQELGWLARGHGATPPVRRTGVLSSMGGHSYPTWGLFAGIFQIHAETERARAASSPGNSVLETPPGHSDTAPADHAQTGRTR